VAGVLRGDHGDLKPLADLLSLRGERALITGAASGIGAAMARRFAEAGAGLELVSDVASYVQGALVPVDGGFLSA